MFNGSDNFVLGSSDGVLALINAGASVRAFDKDGLTGKYSYWSIIIIIIIISNVHIKFLLYYLSLSRQSYTDLI